MIRRQKLSIILTIDMQYRLHCTVHLGSLPNHSFSLARLSSAQPTRVTGFERQTASKRNSSLRYRLRFVNASLLASGRKRIKRGFFILSTQFLV